MDDLLEFETPRDPAPSAKTTKTTRKNGRKTVITRQEFDASAEEEDGKKEEAGIWNPIFTSNDVEERAVSKIRVYRKDPHEGFLGYLEDPGATEQEIIERWGGSFYRVDGCNQSGSIVVSRSIKLAGDPIFVSNSAKVQWERARGLTTPATPAQQGQPGLSFQELMAMMKESESQRRTEEREAQERMRKLELEAADRARKDDEERDRRRLRDEEAREERRRKDDEARDERRRKDAADAEHRQQQFFAQTLSMVKESSAQALAVIQSQPKGNEGGLLESLKVIAAIKETFSDDKPSAEEGDMMSMIIKHGPEWLSSAGTAIGGAIREVKGGSVQPGNVGARPVQQIAATGLQLGALQPKVEALVTKIAARGQDPEQVLSQVLDHLIAVPDGNPPVKPVQPSAPAISYAEQAKQERLKREAMQAATTPDLSGMNLGQKVSPTVTQRPAKVGPVTDGTVSITFP